MGPSHIDLSLESDLQNDYQYHPRDVLKIHPARVEPSAGNKAQIAWSDLSLSSQG